MKTTNTSGEQKQGGHRLPNGLGGGTVAPTNTNTKMTTGLQYKGDTTTAARALDLLNLVVSKTATQPEKIELIQKNVGLTVTIIEIRADAANYGAINGRQGANIGAIRSIAKVFSDMHGVDLQVRLIEVPGGIRQNQPKLTPRDDWDREGFQDIMQNIFNELFREVRAVVSDIGGGESVVEVFVGPTDKASTAEWLSGKLQPLVQHMAALYQRKIQILVINQVDNMHVMAELPQE